MTLYKNHDSVEKLVCREKIIQTVEKIRQSKSTVRVLTLPSTNFYLEEVLLNIPGVTVDCCERERGIYNTQLEIINERRLNIQLSNNDIFEFIKESSEPYDLIWLDLCGPLQKSIINNFLCLVQSREFISRDAYIALTILGAREPEGKELVEFYDCKDLKELRESRLISLAQEYASMAGKACDLIDTYKYISGVHTPMIMHEFHLKQLNQEL